MAWWTLLGALLLLCGAGIRSTQPDVSPAPIAPRGGASPPRAWRIPSWAAVARAQVTAAETRGWPVAFVNPLGMRFVLLPPRSSSATPGDGSRLLYLQATEVASEVWLAWRQAEGRSGGEAADIVLPKGIPLDPQEGHPVRIAEPEPIPRFARWVTERHGAGTYRPVAEAEWEHAALAGGTTLIWWGRYESPVASENLGDHYARPLPCASLQPNRWGLWDTLGNLREWCAASGDGEGAYVLRGASWKIAPRSAETPEDLRWSGAQLGQSPLDAGFRLVFEPGSGWPPREP